MCRAIYVIAVFLCAFSVMPLDAQASTSVTKSDEAASFFDNGEYSAAYKRYLKLAKDGDLFAQYRVSFMKLTGLGTKANASEAMAWAVVAAKSGDAELVRYREAVAELVPVKKRKSTERKATTYVRRWGPEDARYDDAEPVGGSGASCTGSRLHRNCFSHGAKPSVQIAWGEDLSGDPAQRERIEELNREIVEKSSIPATPAKNH